MAEKKKKKNKQLRRKIAVSAVALLLVAGLVFSAVFGFADYMLSGDRGMPPPAQEESYLSALEGLALSLEESLASSPDDEELKLQLGDIYLELAMVHGSLGEADQVDRYAQKGEDLIKQIEEETLATGNLLLKMALLLAFYQDDQPRAEEYFQSALDMDEENSEVHFYYGMYLSLQEREEEFRKHMEKVLELEPEGSYLAEMARMSLEESSD